MNAFQINNSPENSSAPNISASNEPSHRTGPLPIVVGVTLLVIALASGFYYKIQKPAAPILTDFTSASPAPTPEDEIYPPVTGAIVSPSPTSLNYSVPANWKKTFLPNHSITVCLPPKWELDQWGGIFFNRDARYQPNITYLQDLPFTSGTQQEAYFQYWQSEYPQIRSLVSFNETTLGNNTVLTVLPTDTTEPKSAPDGGLAVIWFANGKLWKAGLSNWNMINPSQTAFLKDFYTAISCSFTD